MRSLLNPSFLALGACVVVVRQTTDAFTLGSSSRPAFATTTTTKLAMSDVKGPGEPGPGPPQQQQGMPPPAPTYTGGAFPQLPTPPTKVDQGPLRQTMGRPLNTVANPASVLIQGGSLRTFPVGNDLIDAVQLCLETEGRPLKTNIELWHGPDYTPMKMKVYTEDGMLRPFNALLATPLASNTIGIFNTADLEFPFAATVEGLMRGDYTSTELAAAKTRLQETNRYKKICQGGSVSSFPMPPDVESVQVLLKTDGRNIKARVELMQGPNNDKQTIEFYASDGKKRPFFAIIETPGSGNMVRIINQYTVEFPFDAYVAPYATSEG